MEKHSNKTVNFFQGHARVCYLHVKSAWAGWMERQSLRLGRRGLIAAFAAFLALSICGCLWPIAFSHKAFWYENALPRATIKSVKTAPKGRQGMTSADRRVAKDLKAFHAYMDSLAASPQGKALHDSILQARPGLMDSIKKAEKLYLTKINENEN